MTGGQNTKIRLVICPKCRLLLPELADLPVYQCGGCGIVLQAKLRRNDLRNTTLGSPETDTVHSSELEHVSEDDGTSSTRQCVNLASEEKCSSDENNSNNSQNESGDCSRDQLEVLNDAIEVSSSAELAFHEHVESPVVSGRNSEVDENVRCSSHLESSSSDNLEATSIKSPETTDDNPVVESTVSPSHEQLEQSLKSVVRGFDRVRSTDTLDTSELNNPSSELSGPLRDMVKSPTTKSAHAYDGSISSCDGTHDQVPDPHSEPYRRTFRAAEFGGGQESLERGNIPVRDLKGRKVEMQPQARNSFSTDKKHYAKKYSAWDPDAPLEPPRHGHQTRLDDDESSRVPFYLRNSQAVFENGSPSSHWHDEFQCNSRFCSPDNPKYPEQDKIKLLTMVYELQDQLDRTHIARVQANPNAPTGAARKEKQKAMYYNHEAHEEEIYHDSSYRRYPRWCWQGENCPHQSKFSQIPFSGEATNRRFQVDDPHFHCYPPDWQCSVQLHPPIHCCNKGLCRVHLGLNCYSVHNSCLLTPLSRHVDSEVPLRGPYTKSNDQRHKDDGAKKFHMREKHHLVKRHFRPIAGGAPFVTCDHCLKPLQLPADFLLFKRRCHQLRCGACSKVLKFSLRSSNHILPYARGAIDPMSGEVDDSGRPVSFSEDYGETFHKSGSTEGERVYFTPPFRASQGNAADDRKMSYGSSFEPVEERKKMLSKQSLNRYKNPVNTYEAAVQSSNRLDMAKRSSEIDELVPKTSSPLHRLMGYNSASELLKRSGTGTNLYE